MPKNDCPFHCSEAASILERYAHPDDPLGLDELTDYILRQPMKPSDWDWLLEQPQVEDALRTHLILAYEADWWDRDKERWARLVREDARDQYEAERLNDPHPPPTRSQKRGTD